MFDRDSLWTKISVVDFSGMSNVTVISENQAGFLTICALQLLSPPKYNKTENRVIPTLLRVSNPGLHGTTFNPKSAFWRLNPLRYEL